MSTKKESGFAHIAIIVPAIIVLVIGLVGWRVVTTQQERQSAQTRTGENSAAPTSIEKLSLEEQEKLKAATGNLPPTAETTPTVATTTTTPPKPVNNSTTGAAAPAPAPAPTPAASPAPTTTTPPPPAPTVQRPTAEFCAQKDGNSFTNVWFTGTSSYTYDGYAWESGYSYTMPRVSKTESGTPLYSYDSMQIFDVVAYGTQPQWAICSDKPGYVMVYYSVPSSPYTFNVLAKFEHLSLQQP